MTKVQKRKRSGDKFSSFFAGIGGFDCALDAEGFEPALQCEIDDFCQKVLASHWPDVALVSDITKICPNDLPDSEIWCGGFPCQDVSVARGSKGRDGLKGKNSGLFYSFLELVEARKPETILLENVVGLLSSHNGQDFRVVVEALTKLGYSVAWRIMNSRYFGAPQSRPRVFVCASRTSQSLPLEVLYESNMGQRPAGARKGFLAEDRCPKTDARVAHVAYCLAATSGRHTGTDWSRTYVSYEAAVRRLTPTECEGIQGFPVDWTNVGLNSDVVSLDQDSFRYKALGNAVSVPVAKWIATRLKSALANAKKNARQLSIRSVKEIAPDFAHKTLRQMKLSDLHYSESSGDTRLKWQSGGYAYRDNCWDISAPEGPAKVIQTKLIGVIDKTVPDKKYFLSPNAAEGILRRVESQNRTLFPPMSAALKQMVANKKSKHPSIDDKNNSESKLEEAA